MQEISSCLKSIQSLNEQERNKILSQLSDDECESLLHDWKFWARDEQLVPDWAWEVWLILTGRGWGKTRVGSEWVIDRVRQGYRRIALVGQSKADVRDTMVELGDSSILAVSSPKFMPVYEPSKRRLVWQNGATAIIYSGDEPGQLRGPQHDSAWVDELAKFKYPQETWDNLEMGVRIGANPQIVVTTTPRPIPIIRNLIKDKKTHVTRGSTYSNRVNLSESFINRIISKYEGTRLGRQELKGEVLEDTPGALWNLEVIEASRVKVLPSFKRVVVAIDPPATSKATSNEAGIITAGLGFDNHAYVLFDSSAICSPNKWATLAIVQYGTWKADLIVAEDNNGGEMVENTIRMLKKNVNVRRIHASRGKVTRAEPVAALYEQGKIHHVGSFPELEDQMCHWIPGEDSPDRMDALVWAITELLINAKNSTIYEEPYETEQEI